MRRGLPVDTADAVLSPRQEPRREVAERRDHARLHDRDLPVELPLARLDLVGLRIAVAGRAALDDVRDVAVGARPRPISAEQLVEQPPGLADERHALLVLVEPRRLADEHQVGIGIPVADHDRRAALGEPAVLAARPLLGVAG